MKKSVRFLSKKSSEYIGEVLLFRKKLSALVNIKELIDSNQEKNTEKFSQNKFFDFAEMAQINIQEILTFRKQTLLAAVNSSCKKGRFNIDFKDIYAICIGDKRIETIDLKRHILFKGG